MLRSFTPAVFFALALAACTPSEVSPKPVNIAPPPPPTKVDARGAALVSLLPMSAPATVTVDGDLKEWGDLSSPPQPVRRPPTLDEIESVDDGAPEPKIPEPPTNSADAASKVVVAFTADGAYLAADLGEAAKEGVWVGLGSTPAEMPIVGEYFGRMGFQPLNCKSKPMVSEDDGGGQGYWIEDRTPEEVAACKGIKSRYREMGHKHEERFAKMYRVDPSGVRVAGPGGALTAIEGAKSVWKAGPHGATVEVSLPLTALPRMAEAPLAKVRLLTSIDSTPPAGTPDQWLWFKLPGPVGFEPFAALRSLAFQRANDVGDFNAPGTTMFKQSRGLSFSPGDPLHLEIMDSESCDGAEMHEIPLFEKLTSYRDVEIVRVSAPRGTRCRTEMEPWIASLNKGQIKEIVKLNGPPTGKMLRGEDMHILSYDSHVWEVTPGEWSALAFNTSGEKRAVPVEPVPGYDPFNGKPNDGPAVYWEEATEMMSADNETFGWRGQRGGKGFEAIWKWDEASKSYKADQHKADIKKPAPKKPAPKKPAPKKPAPKPAKKK